jgi:hypothetical protein
LEKRPLFFGRMGLCAPGCAEPAETIGHAETRNGCRSRKFYRQNVPYSYGNLQADKFNGSPAQGIFSNSTLACMDWRTAFSSNISSSHIAALGASRNVWLEWQFESE